MPCPQKETLKKSNGRDHGLDDNKNNKQYKPHCSQDDSSYKEGYEDGFNETRKNGDQTPCPDCPNCPSEASKKSNGRDHGLDDNKNNKKYKPHCPQNDSYYKEGYEDGFNESREDGDQTPCPDCPKLKARIANIC